jgi:hypothetical protein
LRASSRAGHAGGLPSHWLGGLALAFSHSLALSLSLPLALTLPLSEGRLGGSIGSGTSDLLGSRFRRTGHQAGS